MTRTRPTFTEDFKEQIVALCSSGKKPSEIIKDYGISQPTLYKWVREKNNSGSFKAKDNRTPEENELLVLKKENDRLRMENDILKQAALIMGRKSQ